MVEIQTQTYHWSKKGVTHKKDQDCIPNAAKYGNGKNWPAQKVQQSDPKIKKKPTPVCHKHLKCKNGIIEKD